MFVVVYTLGTTYLVKKKMDPHQFVTKYLLFLAYVNSQLRIVFRIQQCIIALIFSRQYRPNGTPKFC